MKKLIPAFTGLLFLVAFVAGCAKPPQEALDAAQAAIAAAEQGEANLYVADLFQAAQDSLAAAQAEIEAQNAKSAFSRNYDHAAALLGFAQQTATDATAQVATRKEEMRVANEELIMQAAQAAENVTQLLAKAPKGKDGAAALAQIQADAAAAAQTLDEARAAQAGGSFAQARDLAQAALDKANGLATELETAIARTR